MIGVPYKFESPEAMNPEAFRNSARGRIRRNSCAEPLYRNCPPKNQPPSRIPRCFRVSFYGGKDVCPESIQQGQFTQGGVWRVLHLATFKANSRILDRNSKTDKTQGRTHRPSNDPGPCKARQEKASTDLGYPTREGAGLWLKESHHETQRQS